MDCVVASNAHGSGVLVGVTVGTAVGVPDGVGVSVGVIVGAPVGVVVGVTLGGGVAVGGSGVGVGCGEPAPCAKRRCWPTVIDRTSGATKAIDDPPRMSSACAPARRDRRVFGARLDEPDVLQLAERVPGWRPSVGHAGRALERVGDVVEARRLGAALPHDHGRLIERVHGLRRPVEHGGRAVRESLDEEPR